jgi:microcystin-dependent protein
MPKSKTDFTNFVDARPNYFPGQFLLEDDFEVEQKYLIDRQKYHRQSLHVSGIVEGLEVEVINDRQEVQIKSGSGINSNGDLIVLKKDTSFSQFASLTNGELYISYREEKQVKQQEDFTRWQEVPTIGFADTTPNHGVKLAKISIVNNVLTLDLTVRDYSGIFLPNATGNDLTLRSGGNANPNVAILNGSLTVTGTITGKIDATNINSENLTVTNVLKIGQDATGGTRDWMKRGMSILWDTDNLFIGLKDEGSNRKDAVIAWGDDPQDDLRFIHVQAGGAANGTEVIRVKPSGNVGIGTVIPSEKLEVSGNLKVTGTITGNISATNINSGVLAVDRIPNLSANKITSGILTIPGSSGTLLQVGAELGSAANIDLSGHVQLKEHGTGNLAYLQARNDNSNRNIGLRIRTQKQGTTNRELVEALTISPTGNVGIGTETPSEKLEVSGNLTVSGAITAGGSDIYFTQTDHTHTGFGNTAGYAAIENSSNHNALMILGRAGTAQGRCVKLWDYLEVIGNLKVTGTITGNIDATNVNSGVLNIARIPILDITRMVIITGMIVMWSGDEINIPTGWGLCNGQDGRPDLRGRFILGSGQGSGLTNRTKGMTGGVERYALTVAEMPTHNHGITDPGHAHNWTATRQEQGTDDKNYTQELSKGDAGAADTMSKNTNSVTTGISIQNNGSGQAHENMPPFYVLAFIIKL